MTLDIGIHKGISEKEYHADPGIEPTASASALRTVLRNSPRHAWQAHPRLNPAFEPSVSTPAMDRGTILHSLVLETEPRFRVLDVVDYKKDVAKALKKETEDAGLIPVKIADIEELRDTASAVRERLRDLPEVWKAMRASIKDGGSETTLIARINGVLCRCRYDQMPALGSPASYDLKFTTKSAEPEEFGRTILKDHMMQADLYPRMLKALRGDQPLFVFVAAEQDPPYGISLHALDPEAREMAADKVRTALNIWRRCLKTGDWYTYNTLIHYHSPKPWELTSWEFRKEGHDLQDDDEVAA